MLLNIQESRKIDKTAAKLIYKELRIINSKSNKFDIMTKPTVDPLTTVATIDKSISLDEDKHLMQNCNVSPAIVYRFLKSDLHKSMLRPRRRRKIFTSSEKSIINNLYNI